MEEEADEDEEDEGLHSPPHKKIRTENIVLDEEEAEIASGLRPVHETRRDAPQLEEDMTMGQDVDSAGSEGEGGGGGGAVDDYNGDRSTGFENNGVCP